MNKRRGLGRGLGALFPVGGAATVLASSQESVMQLAVEDIEPNPNQPRRHLDQAELDGLADSIRANGLLAPILVRPFKGDKRKFQIIAGERRWRAAQIAGLRVISAVVRPAEDGQAIELALIENVQRTDLNPIEEAAGYRQLLDEHAFTQETLSRRLGRARPTIANALRLLTLPDTVQAMIRDGKLSAGHGRAIAALPAPVALRIARHAASRDLSVREIERLAARAAAPRRQAGLAVRGGDGLPPELADVESRLRFALATRVTLTRAGAGGTIEIAYANDDDLQRIIDRICPREP
jgi:ParB family chromosome partitioning protein